MGLPCDSEGQIAVLRATLMALQNIDHPGGVVHLPFEWGEPPEKARSHPPEVPPIGRYLQRHPWDLPRLLKRNVPK
jgi:hypothetical protein